MEKERLLSNLQGDDRILASKILDQVELSIKRSEPVSTDFLDPREKDLIKELLHFIPEVKILHFGGYRQAERERLVILPAFYLSEAVEPPLAFFKIVSEDSIKFTHRDILGSIMGLGLKREKVGDILISNNDAQIITAKEIGEFVESSLEKVGSTKVRIDSIDPEQLNTPVERVKEIKTTVDSLRLDAVAGVGFGVSRTRIVREIKAEKVKVNWKQVTSPDFPVKAGDIMSIRGRGRVLLAELTGQSKKGRTGIILKRYL